MVQNLSNIESEFTKRKHVKVESITETLNLPSYHKGELLHSYLHKVAVNNGFLTVDELLKFVQGLPEFKGGRNFTTGYDAMGDFSYGITFEGAFDWLHSGTLFSPLASFSCTSPDIRLREYQKVVVLRDSISTIENLIDDVYVCPDCIAEEGNGWYYHTEHQMPYLTYCPTHGTRLLKYSGVKCLESDKPTFQPTESYEMEDRLASFSKAILQSDITCSVYGIIGVINTKLEGMTTPYRIKPYIKGRADLINRINPLAMRDFINDKKALPVKDMMALIGYLFDTPEEFTSLVPSGADYREEFDIAIRGRFEILGSYRNDAVMLRCLNCGDVFYAYPPSLIRTPVCMKEVHKYE